MSSRKKDRQLFEILKSRKPVIQEKELPAPAPSEPPPSSEPELEPRTDLVGRAPSRPELKPVVSLKQETCIFGAIIVILLVVFSFILGYSKGKNDAGVPGINEPTDKETSEKSDPKKIKTPVKARASVPRAVAPLKKEPTAPKKQIYTIRAWTGGKNASSAAHEVVAYFQQAGLASWTVKDNEGIKVFVGKFKSTSDPEAKRTRDQVKVMLYKGDRSFKDCYFVKTEG
jgi:hypothetical protein